MADFKIPASTLESPHYYDAILWVYSHMMVIGLVMLIIGLFAEGERFKKWMSWLMLLAHSYYTYLDFRSSDSIFGNGLYQGGISIIPAITALLITLLFLNSGLRLSRGTKVTSGQHTSAS